MFRHNLLIGAVLVTLSSGCSLGQRQGGYQSYGPFGGGPQYAGWGPQYTAPLFPGDHGGLFGKHRHPSRNKSALPFSGGQWPVAPMTTGWGQAYGECGCVESCNPCGYQESRYDEAACGYGMMPQPAVPDCGGFSTSVADCSGPMAWSPVVMPPAMDCSAPAYAAPGCAAPSFSPPGCSAPVGYSYGGSQTMMSGGCPGCQPGTDPARVPAPVPESGNPTIQQFKSPAEQPATTQEFIPESPMQDNIAPLPPAVEQTMWSVPQGALVVPTASGQPVTQHQVTLPIVSQ